MIYPTTIKQGSAQWLVDWAGQGTGPYEVWLNGDNIATITETNYTYGGLNTLTADDTYESLAPPIEIFDTNESGTAINYQHPAYAFLQWHRVIDAAYYKVEEYDGAWSVVSTMPELGTLSYYQYHTTNLDDKDAKQYRVSAYDTSGNTRIPVEFDFTIRCLPGTPDVNIAWNSGTGEIEVTA